MPLHRRRRVLVTGANRGIGKELVRQLRGFLASANSSTPWVTRSYTYCADNINSRSGATVAPASANRESESAYRHAY
jgi:NAD(P)-dependent dehydrogenase (short-subunit alcohol dehydrogenase family)